MITHIQAINCHGCWNLSSGPRNSTRKRPDIAEIASASSLAQTTARTDSHVQFLSQLRVANCNLQPPCASMVQFSHPPNCVEMPSPKLHMSLLKWSAPSINKGYSIKGISWFLHEMRWNEIPNFQNQLMQISGFCREQTRPYQTVGDEDVRPNGGNLKNSTAWQIQIIRRLLKFAKDYTPVI